MKGVVGTWGLFLFIIANVSAQVDTSYVYNRSTPYGTLDIRIRKSASRFYYLQENKTVSFRQNGSQKTNSYFDMTTWDSSPYTQGNMREKNGTQDYFIMNYRLLFPVAYKPSYSEGYPIIVMMHGAGERGNCWTNTCYHADRSWRPHTNNPAASTDANSKLLNNDHNLLHGGKPHLDARNLAGSRLPNDASIPGRSFPGFVLFPQNMNGWDANAAQDAIKLVRLIAKKYNVDEDRIYIHGLSNGGGAVYQAIKRAPWLFAAALTMSAADDGGIHGKNLAPTVAHIPMWIFQGGQDKNPTVSKTEGYLKKFRDAGAVVRYNLYPELGHGTWNTAYKEPDFFKWILSQNKANIHTFAGGRAICGTTKQGVRMELAKGFRKYQWQKNGVTISGATGPTYVATSTGTYRARFSRVANPGSGDWNDWSDPVNVTLVTPPRPKVDQIGTLMLKDLNGYGNARLVTTTDAAHYYWYKNGSLVNLSGNRDDTTRNPIFYQGNCTAACTGNGKYTLVTMTADKCPSPASTAKYVVFNNQAPTNITAPTGFTGKTSSMTSASFNWNDVSTNEIGFEVWRRKAGAKWEMRKITTPNVRSFTDTGLDPSSTYHYKIRAVNNNGKSNYTPAASNAYVIIKTGEDNTNPSVPQTLTAKAIAINTIQLSWKASTDNTGLKQYKIYNGSTVINTNSKNTTYTLSNLTLNKVYNFTVRAEDLGGNLSGNSNSATANTYVSGLYYEHSTGAWNDLDNINWSSLPEFEGHVKNFTLAPRTQEDFFNFEFDGYVYINKAGSYKFRTNSSDGSRLTLDNTVIVNNDGIHGNRTITSAARTLSAGPHKINLKYFEYDGTQTLIVQYYGPDTGNKWITIP
ncbi:MAG TPA: fibronectin type III domain-containing protein, partial [Chryseosolibacter sp.]|nr:fibronectin type III domain-containing protein [Chryseosolibacter sp.]